MFTCQSLDYYNCWHLVYLFKSIFVFSSIQTYVFTDISLSVLYVYMII